MGLQVYNSLATVQVQKVESLISLTTTFQFSFQILRLYSNTNGRFNILSVTVKLKGNVLCITLYAPNEDEPSFFQDFFDHLSDFQCDDLIGGDLT